jgi:hypothetical protein
MIEQQFVGPLVQVESVVAKMIAPLSILAHKVINPTKQFWSVVHELFSTHGKTVIMTDDAKSLENRLHILL